MKQKVLNFFAGPGAGKSTMAAAVFAELKFRGVNCELVTEYAKELCWLGELKDASQSDISEVQIFKQDILRGKVDLLITDSPLLLGLIYGGHDWVGGRDVRDAWQSYDNWNVFVERDLATFQQAGRVQDSVESQALDISIAAMLKREGEGVYSYRKNRHAVAAIANYMECWIKLSGPATASKSQHDCPTPQSVAVTSDAPEQLGLKL